MKLQGRIEKLEAKRGGTIPEPLVILFRRVLAKGEVRVTGAEPCEPAIRFAMIGAGQYGEAVTLRLLEGETKAAFLSRVEAESIRIHGRLPADWNAECTAH